MKVAPARTEYRLATLGERAAPADPFRLFARWFRPVLAQGGADPHAMTLATADRRGRPSARTVLLKEWTAQGFVFAGNLASRKGRELAANDRAALLFYWPDRQRQVRVEGRVAPLGARANDAIWADRPPGARLGAWASPQSRRIESRAVLEARLARAAARFAGGDVPRPPQWGGWRLVPDYFEFWQGRANRLHDRLAYTKRTRGWARARLAP